MKDNEHARKSQEQTAMPWSFVMRHFSLAQMLLFVCLVALLLSAGVSFGEYAVVFEVWLCGVCLLYSCLPPRAGFGLLVVATLFSLLPWLDVTGYSFAVPGSGGQLPTMPWPDCEPDSSAVAAAIYCMYCALNGLYLASTIPLELAVRFLPSLSVPIMFPDSSVVRPFMTFVFWFGTTLSIVIVELFRRLRRKARTNNGVEQRGRGKRRVKPDWSSE